MNFELGTYNVRLTFNPADVTIRMEHRENRRLYESVFMTEDFDGLAAIGGLTTIEKILKAAFGSDGSAKIIIVEEKIDTLTLKVEVSGLISKCWTLGLAARRRESGDTAVEVEELRTKIKLLEEEVQELKETIDETKNVEYVILPGCPVIIPRQHGSIRLTDNMVPDIIMECNAGCGVGTPNKQIRSDRLSAYNLQNQQIPCASGHWNSLTFPNYMKHMNPLSYEFKLNVHCYLFEGTNIKPLSVYKKTDYYKSEIRQRMRMGVHHRIGNPLTFIAIKNKMIQDCSPLGEIISLTHIELCCPHLRDISWAKNLKQLTELNLEGCTSLSDVNALAELPALTKLNIKGTNVKNTAALTNSRLMIEK